MSRITEEMVRKRAEHNEGAIGSLEELSLHMLHIERIEHLDHWCRDLQILLLHNNIITKIENVSRLKKLEYLNLSLNLVERVENLEGCESLNKLDLTLNFIGDLTSVETLRGNHNLRQLTLVGNPCAQFEGYREFVIGTLSQLEELDGKKVDRSQRTQASQTLRKGLRECILLQQQKYQSFRQEQKNRAPLSLEERLQNEPDELEEEKLKKIWSESSEHSPEVRRLMAELSLRQQQLREKDGKAETKPKPLRKFYTPEGRPLNINEAQLEFELTEDGENNCILLKLHLNRNLDTSELSTDVHPDHVRVEVKGRIFQLQLLEEVHPDTSKAERSLASGCLLITMPLVREYIIQSKKKVEKTPKIKGRSKRQLLEIGGDNSDNNMDFSRIVKSSEVKQEEFTDNPEVPPLELVE